MGPADHCSRLGGPTRWSFETALPVGPRFGDCLPGVTLPHYGHAERSKNAQNFLLGDAKLIIDHEQVNQVIDVRESLAVDTLDNHVKHKGVDPQYRPRGYNEGPKE